MKQAKRERLEAAGWKVGGAAEFLALSAADSAMIDLRLELAKELKRQRVENRITQATLAQRIGSSQSRVAKMEAGDPSVSLDLLVRTLLASGSSGKRIAQAFGSLAPKRRSARKSATRM